MLRPFSRSKGSVQDLAHSTSSTVSDTLHSLTVCSDPLRYKTPGDLRIIASKSWVSYHTFPPNGSNPRATSQVKAGCRLLSAANHRISLPRETAIAFFCPARASLPLCSDGSALSPDASMNAPTALSTVVLTGQQAREKIDRSKGRLWRSGTAILRSSDPGDGANMAPRPLRYQQKF